MNETFHFLNRKQKVSKESSTQYETDIYYTYTHHS